MVGRFDLALKGRRARVRGTRKRGRIPPERHDRAAPFDDFSNAPDGLQPTQGEVEELPALARIDPRAMVVGEEEKHRLPRLDDHLTGVEAKSAAAAQRVSDGREFGVPLSPLVGFAGGSVLLLEAGAANQRG